LSGALATFVALAVPDEGGRVGIPAGDGVVEPGDQVVLGLGMVSLQCSPHEDALDRLGHVQPGTAERGVERHDAVVEQPANDRPTQVAGQVVPDEQHTERRQRLGRLVAEPGRPPSQRWPLVLGEGQGWQARQHFGQFGLEPGVQHRVRRVGDAFGADLAGRGTEQRQQLDRPATAVLMGLTCGLPHRCPARPGVRNHLVRTGFILAPEGQPGRLG